MAEDFYGILGVSRDASQAELDKAYRKLVIKNHPDHNPDDKTAKDRFTKIQNAYDTLSDPEKRKMYDRFGSDYEKFAHAGGANPFQGRRSGGAGAGGAGPQFEFDFGGMGGDDFSFEDLLRGMGAGAGGARHGGATWGGPQGRRAPARGADVSAEISVPFRLAALGGETSFQLQRGAGSETITVRIPRGIEDGKKIRLRGQGEASPMGGERGSLILTIRVEPHPSFTRKGNDLTVRVPVTAAEAALGGKVDVPTPKGTITLTVPAGSNSGKRLRARGHGIEDASGTVGDLFVELVVTLPDGLTAEDKEALEALARRHPENPRAGLSF